MGEISFNYNADIEIIRETAFKYQFSESIEHSFIYQRYIAFSDASVFNSPIAITKVATGLYHLCDLFVDRKNCFKSNENNILKSGNKVKYNTNRNEIVVHAGKYNIYNISVYTNKILKKDINRFYFDEKTYALSNDISVLNIYNTPILKSVYSNHLNILDNLNASEEIKTMNVISNSNFRKKYDDILNIYSSLFAMPSYYPELNIFNEYFGKLPINVLNIIDNKTMNIPDNYLNILDTFSKTELPDRLSLNIIPQYFGEMDNRNKMSILDNLPSIFRDSYSMELYTDLYVNKDRFGVSMYEQIYSPIKESHMLPIPDFDFVIKYHIPTDYINSLFNNFIGTIIPISKTKRHTYIDNINTMVQKLSVDGFLNKETSASVIPKNTHVQLSELFFDKKDFKTYIDYKNTQITKQKVYTFINKDSFINKQYFNCYTENFTWIDKKPGNVLLDKHIFIRKKSGKVNSTNAVNMTIKPEHIHKYDSLFVDKTSHICYYDYGKTWLDKTLNAQIDTQLNTKKEYQKTHILDCVSAGIKKSLNTFYDCGVFTDKNMHSSNLFNQLETLHKTRNELNLQPEDFGNWVWVYETPDPFDKLEFGIDELLLPKNDTRYENFEDIIFDKQNMRPRNPIKEIDENTFIAKYPIRHPIPNYSNVGVEYEKSAIELEQFYGIKTSVMHTVFLKFYRIWQSKIFEFGTMTMMQSVNLMLEYLYSWIVEYFPLDEVEQALRVFRLIRWYGETSIIQNSQYIISYEYDTLESKLTSGTCLIPNDLDKQDTMYVDAKLGIIRNNPKYINKGIGAYVTFEVNNRKNTVFTFSLSNTVGSVNIYINDTLIDTVSKSALNLVYELPYTGEVNKIKIEKPASHNLNGTFYIGNIKIPNCTFKELSIEFDPTLKAGNKPLNDIAKKMISYANLYEDVKEAYDVIRKGNLGIEEIYKRLQKYWELHHQGKHKGKRLTIKET